MNIQQIKSYRNIKVEASMKKILLIISIIELIFNYGKIFANEVKFYDGNWEEIKKTAQINNKIIFVDAFNDWCMWCKVFDKETLTNDEVIEYINKNLIPIKLDMETGFGKKLAMKYRVRGLPVQLFFKSDGKLINISSGYREPDRFLELLKYVNDTNNHWNLQGISDEIDINFPPFYEIEFLKRGSPGKYTPSIDEITNFLDAQDNLFTETNWSVIAIFETNEKYNQFFLENFFRFESLFDEYSVKKKLYKILNEKLSTAINSNNDDIFLNVLKMIDKYDTKNSEEKKFYHSVYYYEKTANWNNFYELIQNNLSKKFLLKKLLFEYNKTLYRKCRDTNILKNSIKWIEQSINESTKYEYLLTYSSVLFKIGDFINAKKYAQKANKIGNENNIDTKETILLIELINQKLKR